ncbi:hypothetical protein GNF10_27305 [Nostoc sp. UCD121]|uniref:hypothetical protein n=1 Tax=unclassified Nostoc TaxID=2593658 RepID=UPI001623E52C|nr:MULTISPECIES: hypothetical protein [unclassified Nostoc]MBC1222658.1 hypothetical protein [Nostoc sp. UCD120]MBC1279564.1 hypothetical protein [Nostoc sp. UCD121]MBC1294395.1 hypothetical protein [Nostoc sp. UCD122]
MARLIVGATYCTALAKSAAVGKGFSWAAMPTAGGYAIATACSNLSRSFDQAE